MAIRVGLVGAGNIGSIRARALARSADLVLVGIADPDRERAAAAARVRVRARARVQTPIRVHADHRELVARSDVDAVVVSTPPPLHEQTVLDALAAGKHVLCEKPLSNRVESSRRMVEGARAASRVLATGFNHRYFPPFRRLRQAVESGEIGELDHVRAFAGHFGLPELAGAAWLTDADAMGGGTLMDNGIHLLDLARWVLGEVEEVSARTSGRVWNVPGMEDNAFVHLRSAAGRIATLQSSWNEWRGYRFSLAAYGDRGTAWAYYAPLLGMVVTLDRPGGQRKRRYQLYPRHNLTEKLRGWEWTVVQAFVDEHRDFGARIDGGRSSIASGFDGFRAVEMAHAAYCSSAEGRAVRLCDPF